MRLAALLFVATASPALAQSAGIRNDRLLMRIWMSWVREYARRGGNVT